MNLFLYRLLLFLCYPLIAYYGWKRCKKYQQQDAPIENCFAARFGRNPKKFKQGGIWIHAVSVGETRSIFPLLKKLKSLYPELPLTVTSGSTQGALQALKFSPVEIQHQMIPYDFPSAVNRFLGQLQPKLVIMIETEIWPNLYDACHQKNIPLVLANARLKQKSYEAYQKWGKKLVGDALNKTQLVACQFPVDAQRMSDFEVSSAKIKTLGNLKFDIELPENLAEKAGDFLTEFELQNRFIWVAASTHENEETIVLEAHKQLLTQHPNALLILVPRHADRFNEVAQICRTSELKTAVRSEKDPIHPETQIYLADTVGELMVWFQASSASFIGGSLVPFGGHNILEPAAVHKPVLSGQHYMNLQALYESFIEDDAIMISRDDKELSEQLNDLAKSSPLRNQLADKAYYCFQKQSGALNRLLNELRPFLKESN